MNQAMRIHQRHRTAIISRAAIYAMDPQVCRERARECQLFAQDCADLFVKEALLELAAEFHAAANELEIDPLSNGSDPV
jgi:hypothetical protein